MTIQPIKGRDRWGYFYDLTGNEGLDTCVWCGSSTKRRYCTKQCKEHYHEHFWWPAAWRACMERHRVGRKGTHWVTFKASCGDCGCLVDSKNGNCAVHHIVPLDGEERIWNYLNQPSNLIMLCHQCHMKRHKELNYLLRKAGANNIPDVDAAQLEFWSERTERNG